MEVPNAAAVEPFHSSQNTSCTLGPDISFSAEFVDSELARAKKTGKTPAVIVLPGSFNPPHEGHLRCLEKARNELEKQSHFVVVAGVMAPASDSRLRRKLTNLAATNNIDVRDIQQIRLKDRIRACELLLQGRAPWIGVLSHDAALLVASERDAPCCVMAAMRLVRRHLQSRRRISTPQLAVFQILGLDLLQMWITERHGSWEKAEYFERSQPEERPQKIVMVREGSILPKEDPPLGWYLVSAKSDQSCASSTLCRKFLSAGQWDLARKMLGTSLCEFLFQLQAKGELFLTYGAFESSPKVGVARVNCSAEQHTPAHQTKFALSQSIFTFQDVMDNFSVIRTQSSVLDSVMLALDADGQSFEARAQEVIERFRGVARLDAKRNLKTLRCMFELNEAQSTVQNVRLLVRAFLDDILSWEYDDTGRVDNPPSIAAQRQTLRATPEENNFIRQMGLIHLPEHIFDFRKICHLRETQTGAVASCTQPVALLTVGAPGSGKSYVIRNSLGWQEKLNLPPLSEFAQLDPDYWCANMCEDNNSWRINTNSLQMESFLMNIHFRRNLIVDGTGKDVSLTCGLLIARLKQAGYRVFLGIVLSSFESCWQRIVQRADSHPPVPAIFLRETMLSLQISIPLYLKRQAEVSEAILLYQNEVGKPSSYQVISHGQLEVAHIDLAQQVLQVPPPDECLRLGNVFAAHAPTDILGNVFAAHAPTAILNEAHPAGRLLENFSKFDADGSGLIKNEVLAKILQSDMRPPEIAMPCLSSDASQSGMTNYRNLVKCAFGLGHRLRGVSVYHLTTVLMKCVRSVGWDRNAKVYDIDLAITRPCTKGILCPRDSRMGAAYVDSISGELHAGLSSFMLSYTWGYAIGDITETLAQYCAEHNYSLEKSYVWICCFCINQHRVHEEWAMGKEVPFEDFEKEFGDRVHGIKHMVALMAPWYAPSYLQRVWCCYEMFTALEADDVTLRIVMPEKQAIDLCENLQDITGADRVWKACAGVHIENADASVETDRVRILDVIHRGPGFDKLNNKVAAHLKSWLIDCSERFMKQTEDSESRLKMVPVLHKLLRQSGCHKRADDALLEQLRLHEQRGTLENIAGVQLLRQIGISKSKSKDYAGATDVLEQAYGILEQMDMLETDVGASLLMNIGMVRLAQDDVSGAMHACNHAYEIAKQTGVERTNLGSVILRSLADVAMKLGDSDGAHAYMTESVRVCAANNSLTSVSGANQLRRLAGVTKDPAEAVEHLIQAKLILKKMNALETFDGVELLHAYGQVLRTSGDLRQAKDRMVQARSILNDVQGKSDNNQFDNPRLSLKSFSKEIEDLEVKIRKTKKLGFLPTSWSCLLCCPFPGGKA